MSRKRVNQQIHFDSNKAKQLQLKGISRAPATHHFKVPKRQSLFTIQPYATRLLSFTIQPYPVNARLIIGIMRFGGKEYDILGDDPSGYGSDLTITAGKGRR